MKKNICVLDQMTIDKIAAGEVVERPASVVKELVENAIDAGATAVTVEIKEGGISFIRITDNGSGIDKEQVPIAFLRHATSKIRKLDDLTKISSLGFRGEALSSICAVSRMEVITKPHDQFMGTRYLIEGGVERSLEDIGAPDGTTFLIRNLFYNTPVRAKFLKTPATEAGYISSFIEQLALSHPHISFKFIQNGQVKLHTSGNNNLKEVIYQIYGRELTKELIPIDVRDEKTDFVIRGFIGKPVISRGNRNFENYYINGRYVKSKILMKAIEEGYHTFLMQHKYPFTSLYITMPGDQVDINVHPAKMEVRFAHQEQVYDLVYHAVFNALQHREFIPEVSVGKDTSKKTEKKEKIQAPEPFEAKRRQMEFERVSPEEIMKHAQKLPEQLMEHQPAALREKNPYESSLSHKWNRTQEKPQPPAREPGRRTNPQPEQKPEQKAGQQNPVQQNPVQQEPLRKPETQRQTELQPEQQMERKPELKAEPQPAQMERPLEQKAEMPLEGKKEQQNPTPLEQKPEQMELFKDQLLTAEGKQHHRIIGQVFDTYWLVQMKDSLYIIDQHAAHEKVLYERFMKAQKEKEVVSQLVSPPLIISLSLLEQEKLKQYMSVFTSLGFEIESFGGQEYSIRAVPAHLAGCTGEDFFLEILDHLEDSMPSQTLELLSDKIATMACKAAVKGNMNLSFMEAEALIDELLKLENPYNCPHGRPTIITMTKYELEKKFKRIV